MIYYEGRDRYSIQNETHSNATIRIFTTACRYWCEETNMWKSDGVYVGNLTTYTSTHCLATHLTNFGTDFYVPPNTIDFSSVFGKFKSLNENPAVFIFVVTVLGLYILISLYLRYKDKRDIIKWGATPLADNVPSDQYFYLITVQTGLGTDTGTKSKVGFVIAGQWADSGVRQLDDDKRKAFKSGSICNFICGVEEPLGPLTYLRIWHDNSGNGKHKSWYLNVVDIVDLQTDEK
jgi:polycystin 1L2